MHPHPLSFMGGAIPFRIYAPFPSGRLGRVPAIAAFMLPARRCGKTMASEHRARRERNFQYAYAR